MAILTTSIAVAATAVSAVFLLVSNNDRKTKELEEEIEEHQQQLARKRAGNAYKRAANHHKEKIKFITTECKLRENIKKMTEQSISSIEKGIVTFNEKTEEATKRRAELNRELRKLPKESEDYIKRIEERKTYTSIIRINRNGIKTLQLKLLDHQEKLSQVEKEIATLKKQEETTRKKLKDLNTRRRRKIARINFGLDD